MDDLDPDGPGYDGGGGEQQPPPRSERRNSRGGGGSGGDGDRRSQRSQGRGGGGGGDDRRSGSQSVRKLTSTEYVEQKRKELGIKRGSTPRSWEQGPDVSGMQIATKPPTRRYDPTKDIYPTGSCPCCQICIKNLSGNCSTRPDMNAIHPCSGYCDKRKSTPCCRYTFCCCLCPHHCGNITPDEDRGGGQIQTLSNASNCSLGVTMTAILGMAFFGLALHWKIIRCDKIDQSILGKGCFGEPQDFLTAMQMVTFMMIFATVFIGAIVFTNAGLQDWHPGAGSDLGYFTAQDRGLCICIWQVIMIAGFVYLTCQSCVWFCCFGMSKRDEGKEALGCTDCRQRWQEFSKNCGASSESGQDKGCLDTPLCCDCISLRTIAMIMIVVAIILCCCFVTAGSSRMVYGENSMCAEENQNGCMKKFTTCGGCCGKKGRRGGAGERGNAGGNSTGDYYDSAREFRFLDAEDLNRTRHDGNVMGYRHRLLPSRGCCGGR